MINKKNKKIGYLTVHFWQQNKEKALLEQKKQLIPYNCDQYVQNEIVLDFEQQQSTRLINFDANWEYLVTLAQPHDCIVVTELSSIDIRMDFCMLKIKKLLEKNCTILCLKSPQSDNTTYDVGDLFLFDNSFSFIQYFDKYNYCNPGPKIKKENKINTGRKKK